MEKDRIQTKAKAKDPKVFWNLVSEIRNGKKAMPELAINKDGDLVTNGHDLADQFGEFFVDKVDKLSVQTIPEIAPEPTFNQLIATVTPAEVALVARTLKSKKSNGIDGIPMCIIKDSESSLRLLYCNLFNSVFRDGMP